MLPQRTQRSHSKISKFEFLQSSVLCIAMSESLRSAREVFGLFVRRNARYTHGVMPPLFSPPRRGRCKRGSFLVAALQC
jgi:hypothetical protein